MNSLPVYDDRYIKTKLITYGDKVYTKFCGVIVPEDGVECESLIIISIGFLLVHDTKFYLQVYLDNCAYKTVDKQMADYLGHNLFEADED